MEGMELIYLCEKMFGGKFKYLNRKNWGEGLSLDINTNIKIGLIEINEIFITNNNEIYIGNKDEYSMYEIIALNENIVTILNMDELINIIKIENKFIRSDSKGVKGLILNSVQHGMRYSY